MPRPTDPPTDSVRLAGWLHGKVRGVTPRDSPERRADDDDDGGGSGIDS